jgi:hypothetical protein
MEFFTFFSTKQGPPIVDSLRFPEGAKPAAETRLPSAAPAQGAQRQQQQHSLQREAAQFRELKAKLEAAAAKFEEERMAFAFQKVQNSHLRAQKACEIMSMGGEMIYCQEFIIKLGGRQF